jgi:hypothetical protein
MVRYAASIVKSKELSRGFESIDMLMVGSVPLGSYVALDTFELSRFAAPVVSAGNAVNTALSAGSIVIITGMNLGLSCSTPTASWMSDACSSTAWTSSTSLSCTSQAYRGSALCAGVLLRGIAGTLMNTRFSFDGTSLIFERGLWCVLHVCSPYCCCSSSD